LILLPTFSAFAADSETLKLPKKSQISIECLGLGIGGGPPERSFKGRDAESLVLKRAIAGSAIKYELYLYDALILACDQIVVN